MKKPTKPEQTKVSLSPGGDKVPRAARLRTVGDLRRFGSKVINQLIRNEITEGQARAYGYLLSIVKELIQISQIEDRLKALEDSLEGKR